MDKFTKHELEVIAHCAMVGQKFMCVPDTDKHALAMCNLRRKGIIIVTCNDSGLDDPYIDLFHAKLTNKGMLIMDSRSAVKIEGLRLSGLGNLETYLKYIKGTNMINKTLRDILVNDLDIFDQRDNIYAVKIDGKFTLESIAVSIPKHWHDDSAKSVLFSDVGSAIDHQDEYLGIDYDTEYSDTSIDDRASAAQHLIDLINGDLIDVNGLEYYTGVLD